MKLVVSIPAYNESKTVGEVIKRIPRSIEGVDDVVVIVIDDGSKDETATVAKAAGADFVFPNPYNMGLGQTFMNGIRHALKLEADIIVNIDGDNQFDPTEIVELIKPIIESKADMVTGSRFLSGVKIENMSELKKKGNKFFVWLINKLTKKNFTDTQCGFRAYSRDAALSLNLIGGFTYTQEVFLDLLNKGKKIVEVPIRVKYFTDRDSKISGSLIRYGFRALNIIFRSFRDYHPLKFFGIPGLGIFGTGVVLLLYCLVFWLMTFTTTPIRMYFLVGMFLSAFGFLLLTLALIADMFKRMRRTQEEVLYLLRKNEK